ncbi:hypothetical protein [Streptomyces albipurpureus]|uniref:Secreted protein n=1 Tax=Streptomyces albipurpureus TaxID=2897419 RepID=A0ABT0UR49_9ACTN|nr:hypothetical protein [Streptomyces sp. CWNU-1]MCM2390914.1 hypothetical protein [Streptomyces sp. CWNU-1]
MTKTQRLLTAVALAAGASAMAVSGASAAGHTVDQETASKTTSLKQLDQLQELNQLNQVMAVPQHLAPLLEPVAMVAGAVQ